MLTKLCIYASKLLNYCLLSFLIIEYLWVFKKKMNSIHINHNNWRILPTNVPNISSNNLAQIYTSERATVSKHWIMTGIDLKKPKGMKY